MKINITTMVDGIQYAVTDSEKVTNDELCRAITHLEIIKAELIERLDYDYEVFETLNEEDKDDGC